MHIVIVTVVPLLLKSETQMVLWQRMAIVVVTIAMQNDKGKGRRPLNDTRLKMLKKERQILGGMDMMHTIRMEPVA